MNLAVVGPLPPMRSGVADYSAALLPYLRRYFPKIVAVTESGLEADLPEGVVTAIYSRHDTIWRRGGHTLPVYQMGCNLEYHGYVYDLLAAYPGVVDLHDGNLLPFFHALTLERGDRAGYVREVSFCLERGDGHRAAWHALRHAEPLNPTEVPMLDRVVSASIGIVVHSVTMRDAVLAAGASVPVAVIPLFGTPADPSRPYVRTSVAKDDLLLGTFGYMAPSKRLEPVLRAVKRLTQCFPNLRLVCVGELVPGYDLVGAINDLGLADHVSITGYVSQETMDSYMHAVDVAVNLRYPTWGESSATLSRLMTIGKAVVVTDLGSFHELPDDTVVKVSHGEREVDDLVGALSHLLADPQKRAGIGAAAKRHMQTCCSPESAADLYARFLRGVVVGSSDL